MIPTPEATYERARRLANTAMWTISLQRRRINSVEPEDDDFKLRIFADIDFLIVALTRLRRAAELASKVKEIEPHIRASLVEFDKALPDLKTMRDTAEHFDDYSIDKGNNKKLSRKSLEVKTLSNTVFE